jgi:hypothetical protein
MATNINVFIKDGLLTGNIELLASDAYLRLASRSTLSTRDRESKVEKKATTKVTESPQQLRSGGRLQDPPTYKKRRLGALAIGSGATNDEEDSQDGGSQDPVFLEWKNIIVNNSCNPNPWTVSRDQRRIRYDFVDSANCGGTCSSTQSGSAELFIPASSGLRSLNISFSGRGERESTGFERFAATLNGETILDASSPGGGLQCQMGPLLTSYPLGQSVSLLPNIDYVLFISSTTGDSLFHVGAFHDFEYTIN